MIGLFLALLELVRERLIWAKQPASLSSIYLRPLTDEPAEQAVRKAILAVVETDKEQSIKAQQQQQPPIAITELPPKSKPATKTQRHQEKLTTDQH